MAVYARGYRSYDGAFRSQPASLSIAGEGIRMALRRKGVRRLLILIAFMFCVMVGILYFQFGVQELSERRTGGMGPRVTSLLNLNRNVRGFHNFSVLLSSLAAVLVGAGLVADDLRTRALSLYLVRPIRPVDYLVGKALVLPLMLIPFLLLPGLLFWLIVGLWQPPGETWDWLFENREMAYRVVRFYLVGSMSLTGLLLLLSSRTPRRGVVIGLAAAVLFGGTFVRVIGTAVKGALGDALRAMDLMNGMAREIKLAGYFRRESWEVSRQPSAEAVWIVATLLFAVGLYLTWRRARTVEVGE
jgi:hypothetical protein